MRFSSLRWAGLSMALFTGTLLAATVEQALEENISHSHAASKSQDRIDNLDDDTQNMLYEYRNALIKSKSLQGYNKQMRALVAAQRKLHGPLRRCILRRAACRDELVGG
mgnify:CR=1 FL=1